MRRPFYYDPGANPQPRNYRLGTERFTPSDKVQPNLARRARKAEQRTHGISGKAVRKRQRADKRIGQIQRAFADLSATLKRITAEQRAA